MLLDCTPVMHAPAQDILGGTSIAKSSSDCIALPVLHETTDWVSLLQPSRSLLIMLDMSGLTLQHIQHSRQWQGEGLLDYVQ